MSTNPAPNKGYRPLTEKSSVIIWIYWTLFSIFALQFARSTAKGEKGNKDKEIIKIWKSKR